MAGFFFSLTLFHNTKKFDFKNLVVKFPVSCFAMLGDWRDTRSCSPLPQFLSEERRSTKRPKKARLRTTVSVRHEDLQLR